MTYQYLITAIVASINTQNAEDVLALKENDMLNTQLKIYSKNFADREK